MMLRALSAAGGLILSLGLYLATPNTAAAAEVMCSNDFGSCTISNDGNSWISCSCEDFGGDEGTGGDDFEGMNEEELLEVCLDHLEFCDGGSEEGGEGTTGTTDGSEEGGTTVGEDDTDDGEGEGGTTTTAGEEGGTTFGEEGDPTDGNDGGSTAGEEGGDGNTGDEGNTGAEEGASSTGDGEGGGEGDSGGNTAGDGGGSGEEGAAEGAEGAAELGDEGETGAPADGDVEDGKGCSVTSQSGFGLLGLALLGLLGLRRREDV